MDASVSVNIVHGSMRGIQGQNTKTQARVVTDVTALSDQPCIMETEAHNRTIVMQAKGKTNPVGPINDESRGSK